MSDLTLLILILLLVVCLIVTIAVFVLYSGLLSEVVVKTGPPPIKNVTIAYKFKEGAYKDCGAAFTETYSLGPKLSTIGVFYDDPKQRPADKCRYIVGSVLSEGEETPDEEVQKLYEKFGYKVFSLPEVSLAVTTSFPWTSPLSNVVAPFRVYPQLGAYVEERKLNAFPFVEVCSQGRINYMAPLSRQNEFFVPEVKEELRAECKEDDSDEDRGTDITGADSHSDVSSVSGGAPWDSRETSLAASTAASLASSLPLRDVPDPNEEPKLGDHSARGSNASLGSSGSSFEELDMDQEKQEMEEQEEEVKTQDQEVETKDQEVETQHQEVEEVSGDDAGEKEGTLAAGKE